MATSKGFAVSRLSCLDGDPGSQSPASVPTPEWRCGQLRRSAGDELVPTVVYCASGVRSSVAASLLRAKGFARRADILGGYATWEASRSHATIRARSEEHTSELQSLMRISYAVFCLKKKRKPDRTKHNSRTNTQSETLHASPDSQNTK